ncbi:MAG: polysaccharide pyruvyl transferase family protein [Algibacter sp.]|uniref:polysaccharide pyruvyl transferase family protein n=1 Tax=Algibacter sp. TaxID=1872428 RepID=UPI002629FF5D|nr:polysaccharide pyruvyl transferase family protein [Algibacter sp.]MDG1729357.1 polysaccharide pyruvyl transferase family protein [Algibacter sp.]MDG2177328.1 polysaccharide pyruvyl transferase family protein [Algibacter sp.]
MTKPKKIRLFWWSESLLMGKTKENYGDVLGKYLVEKISGKKVAFSHPKKFSILDFFQPIYVTAGSILAHINKKCVVWGSGVIKNNQLVKPAKFLAVRGPETRRILMNQGYVVPEIFGDPALLLPNYYNPKIDKKYQLGIIPHYVDFEFVKNNINHLDNVLVIDLMTNNIEQTTDSILQCKQIVSSSLHGIIVSHAYQIPALWIKFSDKLFGDDIKFKDYFKSVAITSYKPIGMEVLADSVGSEKIFEQHGSALPSKDTLNKLQKGLMDVCPFV